MQKAKKASSPFFKNSYSLFCIQNKKAENAWCRAISSNGTSLIIMLPSYYKFSDVMIAKEAEAVTWLSATTLSITTLNIKTLSIKSYFATLSINDTEHNNLTLWCM
jgi:hypothetical protein